MNLILTSSLCYYRQPVIDPSNGIKKILKAVLPDPLFGLCICSDPDSYENTDYYANELRCSFENEGFSFASFSVLDGRNESAASALLASSNLIILMGGHVPTQNAFFLRIRLKELLNDFSGTVVGISAGTMNAAKTVYAQPELEGEASDPLYQRFLSGLALTDAMILPHYQFYRNAVVDGLRVYEDITYPDSFGRSFYALPDGSYLFGSEGRQWIYGEAYLIEDGTVRKILSSGERIPLAGGLLSGPAQPI